MNKDKLYADLTRDEGKRLKAYLDTANPPNWTIGIGHLIGPGPKWPPRITEITEAECRAFFNYDIQWAIELVHKLFPQTDETGSVWTYEDARCRAMVNMAFNRGEIKMRASTSIVPAILYALQDTITKSPRWAAVAEAIRKSPYAAEIGARAERFAIMFETGRDPV